MPMTPEQRRRILAWQAESAAIPTEEQRYWQALDRFGNDPGYTVHPNGTVYAICPTSEAEHQASLDWCQWRNS